MVWTRFMDMHSGGGQKLEWGYIYIEAPEAEAKVIFYNRFKRNPERVTCTCCGNDFSISCEKSLKELTAFDRGCDFDDGGYVERARHSEHMTVAQYKKKPDVLFISAREIDASERHGSVPQEGYAWCT